jgi:hypothetical protein
MKGIVFIIGLVIIVAIFGLPLMACFMALLGVFLGVTCEVALPLGMFLAVVMIAGIGIKSFFFDD